MRRAYRYFSDSLDTIILQVTRKMNSPSLLLIHHDQDLGHLEAIISNCKSVVHQLEDVIFRYKGFVVSRRSNWGRVRLDHKD